MRADGRWSNNIDGPDALAPEAVFVTVTLYVPSGAFPAAFENVYVPLPSGPAASG